MQSVNQSATVGTVVGFADYAAGKEASLKLGSSPDVKPTEFQRLVANQLAIAVPTLNSVKTDASANVICKTANGATQVLPQGSVCQ